MTEANPKDGLELALHGRHSDWRSATLEADAETWARLFAPLAMAMPGIEPAGSLWTRIGGAVGQADAEADRPGKTQRTVYW